MASLSFVRATGCRRILFYDPAGDRQTISLGRVSKRDAESIKVRVDALLSSVRTSNVMEPNLADWVATIEPWLRKKLERVGLLEPLEPKPKAKVLTLDAFLTDFMERNGATKKPATRVVWRQVMAMLRLYMPEGIALNAVTTGHAKLFVTKLKERGLASATIGKRVGFANQFFQDAVDWELIDRNPFTRVKTQTSGAKSNVEVSRQTIDAVLKHCDTTWATIVALSRFGGLRCPSETLSLKWGDIDWENDRMAVPEPKVEHHEGRGVRSVPIFADLRPWLEAAWNAASDGTKYPSPESYVIDKPAYRAAAMREGGWANANLRTQFLKILKRAGVPAWNRLFHSMRATRQTELEREYPLHVVCAWLGNTEAIAKKNYLLVTEDDYQKAARKNGAENGARPVKNGAFGAPQASAKRTQGFPRNAKTTRENEKTPANLTFAGVSKVETDGLEPTTSCLQSKRSPN